MVEFGIAFLLFYLWHGMGITVGYHRLLAHRSFRCNKFFEYFWVIGGYFCYQGSPIWWATIHRAHHKYSDTPLDPHSPKVHGIKHALYGWMTGETYPPHVDPKLQSRDIVDDKLYQLLDFGSSLKRSSLMNFLINLVFRGALWWLFGWKIALASLLASLFVFNVPQMLNVICHLPAWGYQNFATKDDSANVWWVAFLAMGEGWHNNHHAYPGSAQSGLRWHEFDISWETIRLGKLLGMVSYINVPPAMTAQLARRKGAHARLVRLKRLRKQRTRVAA